MNLSVTGISHHDTPVELREFFAFSAEELAPALESMAADTDGAVLVSTCNRTELYLASNEPCSREDAVERLTQARGAVVPEGLSFFHLEGNEAVRHLFRVAAGIDSLVIGESEILGQVRQAFTAATAAGSANTVLARLFHSALRVGRRARSETAIGAHGLSISALAVSLSRKVLGELQHKTVLVVGAGEAGQRSAAALAQNGVGRLMVTTRRSGLAVEIANQLNGVALPFEEMASVLAEADVVISATAATTTIISAEQVAAAVESRSQRPLVIVDIAVPRDVESSARDVAGVHLFDIDDLEAAAEANMEARRQEVSAVDVIVDDEQSRFQTWLGNRSVEPTIATLRSRTELIRSAELERTLSRLPNLSEEDRQRVEAMSKALINRVLHNPVNYLREAGNEQDLETVHNLFELDEGTEFESLDPSNSETGSASG